MLKTQTVMQLSGKTRMIPPNTIPFDCEDEDDNTRMTREDGSEEDVTRDYHFYVDKIVWEDMNCPSIITVTIEPGDKLNG